MTTATLKRGNQSVSLELLGEGAGTLAISDLGKPNAQLHNSGGAAFPRPLDNYSGLQNITLSGRLVSNSAYSDAIELVDILEADLGSDKLRVDIDLPEYDDDILVALGAGQDSAGTVTYEPGRRNDVGVDLSLTRIGRIDGTGNRDISTPTATGNGPITLTAGGQSVEIETDVTVERSFGRPQDTIRKQPQAEFPYYINKQKTISETLSLGFLLHENPIEDLQTIGERIFRQQLGRRGISLDFKGIYGLGEFRVFPTGSAPFRQARLAGRQGESTVPTLELSRIQS